MTKSKKRKVSEKQLKVEAIDLWLRIGVEVLRDLPEVYEEVEQHLNKKIEEITLDRTKISKKRLKEVLKNKIDWYMTAEEALDLGVIDEIL